MKCLIIYFSQTGNTEMVARAIRQGVNQVAGYCDIVAIKEANPRRLYEYDLIGLGSPVFRIEPANVTAFINNMRFVGGKHVFCFSTHNTMPEHFFPSIIPKLMSRGLIVVGYRDWYGSSYVQLAPKPYLTDGHPDEIDLKEAEEFGREMVERSRRICAGETSLIPPVPPQPPPAPWFNDQYKNKFNPVEFADAVRLNMKKCVYPDCRLCMDNCPMDGIDLSVKPPVFAKPCINCAHCERVCPTGAIEADAWFKANVAFFRRRLKEYWLPKLAVAEAEGRFRRITPLVAVDIETSYYEVYTKHPRWVIGKGPP